MSRLKIFLILGLLLLIGLGFSLSQHQTPATDNGITFVNKPANTKNSTSANTPGQPGTAKASDADITLALKSQGLTPSLQSGDFSIVLSDNSVASWYLVTIQTAGGSSDNQFVILQQVGTSLKLVSGPGTAFSGSDLRQKGVPAAIQRKLLVSND